MIIRACVIVYNFALPLSKVTHLWASSNNNKVAHGIVFIYDNAGKLLAQCLMTLKNSIHYYFCFKQHLKLNKRVFKMCRISSTSQNLESFGEI